MKQLQWNRINLIFCNVWGEWVNWENLCSFEEAAKVCLVVYLLIKFWNLPTFVSGVSSPDTVWNKFYTMWWPGGGAGAGRRRASCWGVDQLRFRVVGKVLNLQGASKNCQPFRKPHFTVTLWIKFKILRSHKQQNVQNIIWLIIIPFIFRETWLGRQHFMKKTKMAFRYKQEQFSPSEGSKYSSIAVKKY